MSDCHHFVTSSHPRETAQAWQVITGQDVKCIPFGRWLLHALCPLFEKPWNLYLSLGFFKCKWGEERHQRGIIYWGRGKERWEQVFLSETKLRSPKFRGKERASRTCRKSQNRAIVVGFSRMVGKASWRNWNGGKPQLGQRQACFSSSLEPKGSYENLGGMKHLGRCAWAPRIISHGPMWCCDSRLAPVLRQGLGAAERGLDPRNLYRGNGRWFSVDWQVEDKVERRASWIDAITCV